MAKSNRVDTESGPSEAPNREEISRRAYEIFLQRGSVPGHETDDWLAAEAELTAEHARRAGEDDEPAAEIKPARGGAESPRRANGRRDPGSAGSRRPLRQ